jgi:hypothetical protein
VRAARRGGGGGARGHAEGGRQTHMVMKAGSLACSRASQGFGFASKPLNPLHVSAVNTPHPSPPLPQPMPPPLPGHTLTGPRCRRRS